MTLVQNCDRLVDTCVEFYDQEFSRLETAGESETDAQRHAISNSFERSIETFGIEYATECWRAIQSAHTARKSGIFIDSATIKAVTSANQSWNKSSGHAFEQSFCSQVNQKLDDAGQSQIRFRIQAEITNLFNRNLLGNEDRDLATLRPWLDSSAFDVYATLQRQTESERVFGCIQCKTSIRDRVTRDREPSLQAMKAFFWSMAVVVDGDFLKLPKFEAMVNGGSKDFPKNGWHTMYSYAGCQTVDRVIVLNRNFSPLVENAVKAAQDWTSNRQWMDQDWKPAP